MLVAKNLPICPRPSPSSLNPALWFLGPEAVLPGITISSSSTRSCLRHFTDTLCSLTSWRVSLRTVVLRQITTSTLRRKKRPEPGWSHTKEGREPGWGRATPALQGPGTPLPCSECLSCYASLCFQSVRCSGLTVHATNTGPQPKCWQHPWLAGGGALLGTCVQGQFSARFVKYTLLERNATPLATLDSVSATLWKHTLKRTETSAKWEPGLSEGERVPEIHFCAEQHGRIREAMPLKLTVLLIST